MQGQSIAYTNHNHKDFLSQLFYFLLQRLVSVLPTVENRIHDVMYFVRLGGLLGNPLHFIQSLPKNANDITDNIFTDYNAEGDNNQLYSNYPTGQNYGVFINLKARGYSSQIIFVSNSMLYRRRLDTNWGAWKKVSMSDL